MQRILDPAQIEGFAQRTIPRIRLSDPATVFAQRAARLRELAANHALGEYLRLMAALSDAQQVAIAALAAAPPVASETTSALQQRMTQAQSHGMPPLQAIGWPREDRWRVILHQLCGTVAALPHFPDGVRAVCERVRAQAPAQLEGQADLLLDAGDNDDGIVAETAPFIMAALQVYWVHMVASLTMDIVKDLAVDHDHAGAASASGVCPVCGTLPVTSIVRADKQYQGYRYLHCALCATEWHLVRVKCSHCLSTEGIAYQSIDGGPEALRAEACESCHTYLKILYQEKDTAVEPVADDLGSLTLDLLMTEAGYHRSSGNPLLWQRSDA